MKQQPAKATRNVTCRWPAKERRTQGRTVHTIILHVTLPTALASGCDLAPITDEEVRRGGVKCIAQGYGAGKW